MITAKAFAGKHYAVLGLGRSGLATVAALIASGARVTAWDDKLCPGEGRDPGGREAAVPAALDPGLRRGTEIGNFVGGDLSQFDSIVVTPGLPLNRHPIAARAAAAGVEIIGDIELFARARPELPPHKVVGITGTNGKSTTTALVHHILKTAGAPTTMGGNIGLPILGQAPLPEGGVYVLELSSYQIDLTKSLDCDVAVLLNITPDHLDRYESFEAYAASKARLFEMQGAHQHAIIALDDPNSLKIYQRIQEERQGKTLLQEWLRGSPNTRGVYAADLKDAELWNANDRELRDSIPDQSEFPSLQGPHNSQNAVVAFVVSDILGIDDGEIEQALRTYPGLPHRMERVREKDGVLFVNDSKATNAEAAAPALAAYPRIRWILGGQAKTHELGDTARHLDHVVRAYTIGEAGPMFAALLRDHKVDVIECETLENAVTMAAGDSLPGDTVLLSPACASFDQFRDFEARGDRFKELVEGL